MQLVYSEIERTNGINHLHLFPIPARYFNTEGDKVPINPTFIEVNDRFVALNHPMQAVVTKQGIARGEFTKKSFGFSIHKIGDTPIVYDEGIWTISPEGNTVTWSNDDFTIAYSLIGLTFTKLITVHNMELLGDVEERMFLNTSKMLTKKGRRVDLRQHGNHEPITISEDGQDIGLFKPPRGGNDTQQFDLDYLLEDDGGITRLIIMLPEEMYDLDGPVYIDPTADFGYSRNIGVMTRTNNGNVPSTYQDTQHLFGSPAIIQWSGGATPGVSPDVIDNNSVFYTDLYVPQKWRTIIREIHALEFKFLSPNYLDVELISPGPIRATILPMRARPLDGIRTGSTAFDPVLPGEGISGQWRVGMSGPAIFTIRDRLNAGDYEHAPLKSGIGFGGANYEGFEGMIFQRRTASPLNRVVAEVFNDFLNSDREDRMTILCWNTHADAPFAISGDNALGVEPITIVLSWEDTTQINIQDTSVSSIPRGVPHNEPSIITVQDEVEEGKFYMSMGVSIKDATESTSRLYTDGDMPYSLLAERANVHDEHLYWDPNERLFNYMPNSYFARPLQNHISSAVVVVASNTNEQPISSFLQELIQPRALDLSYSGVASWNFSNIFTNLTDTNVRHFWIQPLHNMEFVHEYIVQVWARAATAEAGEWKAAVVHGYNFQTNTWNATPIQDDGDNISDGSTNWRHFRTSFTPQYTAAWGHSRPQGNQLDTTPGIESIRTFRKQTLFGTSYSPYSCFIIFYSISGETSSGSFKITLPSITRLNGGEIDSHPIIIPPDPIDLVLDSDDYNKALRRNNKLMQYPFRGADNSEARQNHVFFDRLISNSLGLSATEHTSNIHELPYIGNGTDRAYSFMANSADTAVGINLDLDTPHEGSVEFWYAPRYLLWAQGGANFIQREGQRDANGAMITTGLSRFGGVNTVTNGVNTFVFDNQPRHIFSLGNSAKQGSASPDYVQYSGAGMSLFRCGNSLVWIIRDSGFIWDKWAVGNYPWNWGATNNMECIRAKDKTFFLCQYDIPESMLAGSTQIFPNTDGQTDASSFMKIKLVWGPRMEMYINEELVDINPHQGLINDFPRSAFTTGSAASFDWGNFQQGLMNRLFIGNMAISYRESGPFQDPIQNLSVSDAGDDRNLYYTMQSDNCFIQEFGISGKALSDVKSATPKKGTYEVGRFSGKEVISIGSVISPSNRVMSTNATIRRWYGTDTYAEYEIIGRLGSADENIMSFSHSHDDTFFCQINGNTIMLKGIDQSSPTTTGPFGYPRFKAIYANVNWIPTGRVLNTDTETGASRTNGESITGFTILRPNENFTYEGVAYDLATTPLAQVKVLGYVPDNTVASNVHFYFERSDGLQAMAIERFTQVETPLITYPWTTIGNYDSVATEGNNGIMIRSTAHGTVENQYNGFRISMASNGSNSAVIRDWHIMPNGYIYIILQDAFGPAFPDGTKNLYIRPSRWSSSMRVYGTNRFGINYNEPNESSSSISGNRLKLVSLDVQDRGIWRPTGGFRNYMASEHMKIQNPLQLTGPSSLRLEANATLTVRVWFDGMLHIETSPGHSDTLIRIEILIGDGQGGSTDLKQICNLDGNAPPSYSIFPPIINKLTLMGPDAHAIFDTNYTSHIRIMKSWLGSTTGPGATQPIRVIWNSGEQLLPYTGLSFDENNCVVIPMPYKIVRSENATSHIVQEAASQQVNILRCYDLPPTNKLIIEGKAQELEFGWSRQAVANLSDDRYKIRMGTTSATYVFNDNHNWQGDFIAEWSGSWSLLNRSGISMTFLPNEEFSGTPLNSGHFDPHHMPLYSVLTGMQIGWDPDNGDPDEGPNKLLANGNRWCRFPLHLGILKSLYNITGDDSTNERFMEFRTIGALDGFTRQRIRISATRDLLDELSTAQKTTIPAMQMLASVGEPVSCSDTPSLKSHMFEWDIGSPLNLIPAPQVWFDGRFWHIKSIGFGAGSGYFVEGPSGFDWFAPVGSWLFRSIFAFNWDFTVPSSSGLAADIADLKIMSMGSPFTFSTGHPTARVSLENNISSPGTALSGYANRDIIVYPGTISGNSVVKTYPGAVGGAGWLDNTTSLRTHIVRPAVPVDKPWDNMIGHIRFRNSTAPGSTRISCMSIYKGTGPIDYGRDDVNLGRDGIQIWQNSYLTSGTEIIDNNKVTWNFDTDFASQRWMNFPQPKTFEIDWDIVNDIVQSTGRAIKFISFALSGRRHLTWNAHAPKWSYLPAQELQRRAPAVNLTYSPPASYARKADEEHLFRMPMDFSGVGGNPIFDRNRVLGDRDGSFPLQSGGTHITHARTAAKAIIANAVLRAPSDAGYDTFGLDAFYIRVALGQTRNLELDLTNLGSGPQTYNVGEVILELRDSGGGIYANPTNANTVTIDPGDTKTLNFNSVSFPVGLDQITNPLLEGFLIGDWIFEGDRHTVNGLLVIQRSPDRNVILYEHATQGMHKIFYISADTFNSITLADPIAPHAGGTKYFQNMGLRSADYFNELSAQDNFEPGVSNQATRVQRGITIGHPEPRWSTRVAKRVRTNTMPDGSATIADLEAVDLTDPVVGTRLFFLPTDLSTWWRYTCMDNFDALSTSADAAQNSTTISQQQLTNNSEFLRLTFSGIDTPIGPGTTHGGELAELYIEGWVNGQKQTVRCLDTDSVGNEQFFHEFTELNDQPDLNITGLTCEQDEDVDAGNILIQDLQNPVLFNALMNATANGAGENRAKFFPVQRFIVNDPNFPTVNEFDNPSYATDIASPPAFIDLNSGVPHRLGNTIAITLGGETDPDAGDLEGYWAEQGESWNVGFYASTVGYSDVVGEGFRDWKVELNPHTNDINGYYFNRDENGCPYIGSRDFTLVSPTLEIFGSPQITSIITYPIPSAIESGYHKVEFNITTSGSNITLDFLIATDAYERCHIIEAYWMSGPTKINFAIDNTPGWSDGSLLAGNEDDPQFTLTGLTGTRAIHVVVNLKERFHHILGGNNKYDGNTAQLTFHVQARRNLPAKGFADETINDDYMCADPIPTAPSINIGIALQPIATVLGWSASAQGAGNIIASYAYSNDKLSWTPFSPFAFPIGMAFFGWNNIYFRAMDTFGNFVISGFSKAYDNDIPTQTANQPWDNLIPHYLDINRINLDIRSGSSVVYTRFPRYTELTPLSWTLRASINGASTISSPPLQIGEPVVPHGQHIAPSVYSALLHGGYNLTIQENNIDPDRSSNGWTSNWVGVSWVDDISLNINVLEANNAGAINDPVNVANRYFYFSNTSSEISSKPLQIETTPGVFAWANYVYITMRVGPLGIGDSHISDMPPNRIRLEWTNQGSAIWYSEDFYIWEDSLWHTYVIDMTNNISWRNDTGGGPIAPALKSEIRISLGSDPEVSIYKLSHFDLNETAKYQPVTMALASFGIATRADLIENLVPMTLPTPLDGDDSILFTSRLTDWAGRVSDVTDGKTYYVLPQQPISITVTHKIPAFIGDGFLRAKVVDIVTLETSANVQYKVKYRYFDTDLFPPQWVEVFMDGGNWHTRIEWQSGAWGTGVLKEGQIFSFSAKARNPNDVARETAYSSETDWFSDYITPQIRDISHFSDARHFTKNRRTQENGNVTSISNWDPQNIGPAQASQAWLLNTLGAFFKGDWNDGLYANLRLSTEYVFHVNLRNVNGGGNYDVTQSPGPGDITYTEFPVEGFFYRLTRGEGSRDTVVTTGDTFVEMNTGGAMVSQISITPILDVDNLPGNADGTYNTNIAYIHICPFYKIGVTRHLFSVSYQTHLAVYLDNQDGAHPSPRGIRYAQADGIDRPWFDTTLPAALDTNIYQAKADIIPSLGIKVIDERPQYLAYMMYARERFDNNVILNGQYSDWFQYQNLTIREPEWIEIGGLQEHREYDYNYRIKTSSGIEGPLLLNSGGEVRWEFPAFTNLRAPDTILNIYPSGNLTAFEWTGLDAENTKYGVSGYYEIYDWMNGTVVASSIFSEADIYRIGVEVHGGLQGSYLVKALNHNHVTFNSDYINTNTWSDKPIARHPDDTTWQSVIYDFMTPPRVTKMSTSVGYDTGENIKFLRAIPVPNINQDSPVRDLWFDQNIGSHRIIDPSIRNNTTFTVDHNMCEYIVQAYERPKDTLVVSLLGYVVGDGTTTLTYNETLWENRINMRLPGYKSLSVGLDPTSDYGFRLRARNQITVDIEDNTPDNDLMNEWKYSDWSPIDWGDLTTKIDDDYESILHMYIRNDGSDPTPNAFEVAITFQDIIPDEVQLDSLKDLRCSFKQIGSESTDLDNYKTAEAKWIRDEWESQGSVFVSEPDLWALPTSMSRLSVVATYDNGITTGDVRRSITIWDSNAKDGHDFAGWGLHDKGDLLTVHDDYGNIRLDMKSDPSTTVDHPGWGNLSKQVSDIWYHLKWNVYDDILKGIDTTGSQGGSLIGNDASWADVINIRIEIYTFAWFANNIYTTAFQALEELKWRNDIDYAPLLEQSKSGIFIRDVSIGWRSIKDQFGKAKYSTEHWHGIYQWEIEPKNIKHNPALDIYDQTQSEPDALPAKKPKDFLTKKTLPQARESWYYHSFVRELLEE